MVAVIELLDKGKLSLCTGKTEPSPANHAWNVPVLSDDSGEHLNYEIYDPRINPQLVLASAEYEYALKLSTACKIVDAKIVKIKMDTTQERICGCIIRGTASKIKDVFLHHEMQPRAVLQGLALYLKDLNDLQSTGPFTMDLFHGYLTPKLLFIDKHTRTVLVAGTNISKLARMVGESWNNMIRPDAYSLAFRSPEKVGNAIESLTIVDDIWSACLSVLCLCAKGARKNPFNILDQSPTNGSKDIGSFLQAKIKHQRWISACLPEVEDQFVRAILSNELLRSKNKGFANVDEFFHACFEKGVLTPKRIQSSITDPSLQRRLEPFRKKVEKRIVDDPILITGPTGCGKTSLAQKIHDFIHANSEKPYIVQNCAKLHANLIIAQLFGYIKGAFTGANNDKAGIFEKAMDGTVFLDEIDSLPMYDQARLFDVIDNERYFFPLGGEGEVKYQKKCKCVLIFGTNRDLGELVKQGIIRRDFYSRIAKCEIKIRPLVERPEELKKALQEYWEEEKEYSQHLLPDARISDEAWEIYLSAKYPGNFRDAKRYMIKSMDLLLEKNKSVLTAQDARMIIGESERILNPDFFQDQVSLDDTYSKLCSIIQKNSAISRAEAGIRIGLGGGGSNEKSKAKAYNAMQRSIIGPIERKEARKPDSLTDAQWQSIMHWAQPRRRGKK